MKKNLPLRFFQLMLLIGFSSVCFAQPPHHGPQGHIYQTSLVVSSDQHAFWLFMDDVLQNERAVRTIQLDNVPEGDHYLRVELDDPDHHTVGQLVRVDVTHRSFRIEQSRHLLGLSPGYGVPRPELAMTLRTVQPNQMYAHVPGQNTWFGYHQPGHPAMVPSPAPGPVAMNEADFNMALEMVKKEHFDSNRLALAKQITRQTMLSVSQIKRLCQTFEFDNTKLDFAKYAYTRCVDPERYFLLYDIFTFDSNKRSLDSFLQQQH